MSCASTAVAWRVIGWAHKHVEYSTHLLGRLGGGSTARLELDSVVLETLAKKKPSHMEDFYFRVNTVISFVYLYSPAVAMPGLIVLHQLRVHQLLLRLLHHVLPLF